MRVIDEIVASKIYVMHFEKAHAFETVSVTKFNKKGSKINPVGSISYDHVEKAIGSIPKHSDLIISLSGDHILTRFSESIDAVLFPEIDEEEFILQTDERTPGYKLQSICRREYIDELIKQVSSNKYYLLNFVFAEVAIVSLVGILAEGVIRIGNLEYAFSNGDINRISEVQDVHVPNDQYNVSDESLNRDELISLASILYHHKEEGIKHGNLHFQAEQSKFFKKYKRTGLITLSCLFLLLLVNFFFYDSSKRKLERLKIEMQDKILVNKQIEALQIKLSDYNQLTNPEYGLKTQRYAFYLDRFGILRPEGLWFNTLDVFPLKKKQSSKDRTETVQNIIRLSGEVDSPSTLNHFIKSLKTESWVKNVELSNYAAESGENKAVFSIEVRI